MQAVKGLVSLIPGSGDAIVGVQEVRGGGLPVLASVVRAALVLRGLCRGDAGLL